MRPLHATAARPISGSFVSPLYTSARTPTARRPRSAAFSTAARDAAAQPPSQAQGNGGNHNNKSSTSTNQDQSRKGQSRRGLVLLSSALLSTGLLAGIGLTWFTPRPRIVSLVFPLPTGHPPPEDSAEHRAHTRQIEKEMLQLDLVKQLEAETVPAPVPSSSTETETETEPASEGAPTAARVKKYTVSRPYAATRAGPHSLSAYTLRGPGKFAVPPLVFTTHDKRESVLVLHVGDGLCGHEGVVHGGLLATVLDEALGRTALLNLPTNIGVTATLSLKYKKPTFANQYLVVRTELTEKRGRKAFVKGRVEDLEGHTLVEAEALFVEPRMAQFLNSSSVREALK
ncbi:hypothetical protein JCM3774_000756 [Rhodotorula dairenensis]